MQRFFSTESIQFLFHFGSALYVFIVLAIFYLGKVIYDFTTPFDLSKQLTTDDNKAVACAFAGFLVAVGLVLWGVLTSPAQTPHLWQDILDTIIWGLIGIILLQISRRVCEKLILYKFDVNKELSADRNVGTGAVLAGTYIGAGLVVMSTVTDDGSGIAYSFWQELTATLIFFLFGQLFFILFGLLYEFITRYDLHAEIERDNVSAGVAFGMSTVAIGILLSGFILHSSSIPGLTVWFVLSALMIVAFRYLADKVILPGALLDEEIARDQNWGAALIEGGMAIVLALMLNAAFLYDVV